ncbi:hypothetical protein EST38_g1572 [Candolleomyces aberdarensis]|uniref:Calcium-dependent phosphotriesterase n=1 Tax=Candolleomyces aberdarensis TaxID=2316362 RepID=A0A4V1Q541_9AGAR|nr:hypothetical protein EST38_g1572 [Candolleomyces aberdarensis]
MSRTIPFIAVLLAVFLYRSGSMIKNSVLFKTTLPVGYVANGDYAADCKPLGPGSEPDPLNALTYCEDAVLWELYGKVGDARPSSRLLLTTCDANRKSWNTVMGPLRDPNPRGTLWVYPSTSQRSQPKRVTLKDYPEGHDFHPLGFEVWPSYGGNSSNLYVINHARERTVIEQFAINPSNPTIAKHIRTISSPYFVSPNSVALTSPDSFYVTNDHLITRRWPIIGPIVPSLESIFALPLSFISHVTLKPPSAEPRSSEIENHIFAAKFIAFPNGISVSSNGRQAAVASSSLGRVFFYSRDPATNILTPQNDKTVTLPFCPDNVRFTEGEGEFGEGGEDELLVAGHPHFPSIIALAKNVPGATSGSWVVSIIPSTGHDQRSFDTQAAVSASQFVSAGPGYTLKTLFQSNGELEEGGFASSTTGIRDPDTGAIYVAGLYAEKGVMECRPKGGL